MVGPRGRAAGMRRSAWVLAVLSVSSCARALYLPGVAPQDFARDDLVYVKARLWAQCSP